MANVSIEQSTLTVQHQITNDELLELIKQASFSIPEKKKILDILFEQRGYSEKARLVSMITDFVYTQC